MNLTKNCLKLFFLVTIIFLIKLPVHAEKNPFGIDFSIESDAIYLVNEDTNTVIYEKNKDLKIPCSALAKMMTAIIILESDEYKKDPTGFLNKKITATQQIFDRLYLKGASNAGLKNGETLTVKDALYASLVQSACEATMMLVEMMCKQNIEAFVDKMNEKAKNLGMNNTNFTDPDGLDTTNQKTTAYDMYILTKHCLKNAMFKKIATTSMYEIPPTNMHQKPSRLIHTNKMLNKFLGGKNYDSRVKGIKTGKIDDKDNLVSIASENGYHYTLITLGAPRTNKETTIFKETKKIYNWVFKNLKLDIVATPFEKTIPNNIKVNMSKNNEGVLLTPKDQTPILLPANVDKSAIFMDTSNLTKQIDAPIRKGDIIGKVILKLSDQAIGELEVVAAKDVPVDIIALISNYVFKVVSSFWFISIMILLIIASLFILINKKFNPKKNKAKKLNKYKRFK